VLPERIYAYLCLTSHPPPLPPTPLPTPPALPSSLPGPPAPPSSIGDDFLDPYDYSSASDPGFFDRCRLLLEKSCPLDPAPPLLSHARPTADYSSSGACALGLERGGPRRSACIDALTLPLFLASTANDCRTALADGFPSLIPSLPDSTTVEQPAAPFPYPCPTLRPPLVRATCHTPTSTLPALAASSYPIPVRLPSPSNSAHVPHASRSHQYIHTCALPVSPRFTCTTPSTTPSFPATPLLPPLPTLPHSPSSVSPTPVRYAVRVCVCCVRETLGT